MPVSETATHPLDYDPVTNEHTANMTMARTAALEYYQAGKWKQAEAKFLEALAEARLGFDSRDPHIASAQNNLAEFYRNTGQHSKAEALYQEALDLLESIYGERHWLYVSAMHNLALSYQAAGNLGAAEATMSRVMRLRLQMFGSRHFLYADSMFALGAILLQRRQQEVAGGAEGAEHKGLRLMEEAVAIMEDAETIQTDVVLLWLEQLGAQYQARGQLQQALSCAQRAHRHFAADKGQGQADASQLADRLIELHSALGQWSRARDVAAACVGARTQMFGKELAVAHSLLRLANLELQLGQAGDPSAAYQHASNAAALSGELLAEYQKASVGAWLGAAGQDRSVKRARAAFIHASCLKFLAQQSQQLQQPGLQASAQLEQAVSVLCAASAALQQQLVKAAASGGAGLTQQGELADLLVEQQLLLLDCVEQLLDVLQTQPSKGSAQAARMRELLTLQDKVLDFLTAPRK
ncbi:TPR_REGION domain-containing protein [Haematococcus lacustris]|uniref:TPR_REGION domain-containing protein n=1 Tax=Haematococcus lacustris TaxID=44745 RepID=A0A699YC03_HAELA|nr:TPR_REGION domain-containing protein [Haematococcus lacustris]